MWFHHIVFLIRLTIGSRCVEEEDLTKNTHNLCRELWSLQMRVLANFEVLMHTTEYDSWDHKFGRKSVKSPPRPTVRIALP